MLNFYVFVNNLIFLPFIIIFQIKTLILTMLILFHNKKKMVTLRGMEEYNIILANELN